MSKDYSKQIENNFTYHPPGNEKIEDFKTLRDHGKSLALDIDYHCPDGREKSIALTKLEEVIFWANAAIARQGELK